jgi:phage terminase large subunit-like protein
MPSGSTYFEPSLASDSSTSPELPESSPNLQLIETEPWTPPSDAHPEIGLQEFVRGAWRVLEPSVPFIDNWHIEEFCEHLEAASTGRLLERDILINTPPGTSKSLVFAVLWPAWEWTWAPWTRWLTSSYDDALALRDAVRTRTLMQSEWYRARVSEPWAFTSHQNTKGYYLNDKTGWRIATSIGGGNTGWHAHRVLIDDAHNVKKAESDAVRLSTLDAWREVYPSRVLPGGLRIVVGQRVHEEDVTADWLERESETVHHISIKMEYQAPPKKVTAEEEGTLSEQTAARPCSLSGRPHDPRSKEGELLMPQRFPRLVIERRKIELGPYAYAAQYDQTPTPRAGKLLNPAWFPQTPRLERSTIDLVVAFDMNYSDAETSDWTVGLLGAVERTPVLPRIHLVDGVRAHLAEKDHVQILGEWLLLWKPMLVGIEKRAYEKQGATKDLCNQLMAYCAERNCALTIEPVVADTDKVSRAMIIPGRAQAGLITADKRAKFWTDLSKQMSLFPRSQHDDDVDALAHLVRLVVEKLEKVRSQKQLLGKSAQIVVEETSNRPSADWQSAAVMGLR